MSIRENWGVVCPSCFKDDQLTVTLVCKSRIYEDGTDPDGDHTWDDLSPLECECGWVGLVGQATQACNDLDETDGN